MTQSDRNNLKTDQAWKQLYTRLEEDGLLEQHTVERKSTRLQISMMKWTAAIIVLCASAATTIFLQRHDTPEATLLTLQNKESSTSLVTTLEDGSIVYLADDSELIYPEHFQKQKREVTLAGNALFDVSGNRERPFFIETEKIRIEVIGTSFDVRSTNKKTFGLAVRRGEVKVTLKKNGESIRVRAGQTVSLHANRLQVAATQDAKQFIDYTQRIQFKDQRLSDILRVINLEYPDIALKTTPGLEDRRLTVSFHNNTPAMMAKLICIALKLKCTEKENVWMITEP